MFWRLLARHWGDLAVTWRDNTDAELIALVYALSEKPREAVGTPW